MNFRPYNYTEEELAARVEQILEKHKSSCDMTEALKIIFQSIDFTTLDASDNSMKINEFCAKALAFQKNEMRISVPAICIYSPFVKQAKALLEGSGIKVATVACAFPSGQMPFDLKKKEVEYCVEQGADEVDMVISRGTFLEGNYDEVYNEIQAIKEICVAPALHDVSRNPVRLKVILETGELKTVANIRKASELAIMAGADFIKTSTGKIAVNATPMAAVVMCDTIKEYHEATGQMVGFKPAGGMSTIDDALTYYYIVRDILGERWLNKNYFRIGTSRLAGKVMEKLE